MQTRTLDVSSTAVSLDVELTTVMGAISDAVLCVDPEGMALFFNTRLGLLCGSEKLKSTPVSLTELFDEPEIHTAYFTALREGKPSSTKVIPFLHVDGSKNFFSLAISPLRKSNGNIYGAVGIFHDITELKGAEQMRIDFVANVSHELRTPLTAIKGFADTLVRQMERGKSVAREHVETIRRNADRLMNLMEDLLDLSSIESVDRLQKEQISAEELTGRIIKQLQSSFESKQQNVSYKTSHLNVLADPHRIEQVLVNLLSNANKYSPEGGEILVTWEREDDGALLKVKDNGPGIPFEHQARVFERFYRVDKARSRAEGGTGLGLAIVKHIMQRHQGTVWVESRPAQGATFICKFPD